MAPLLSWESCELIPKRNSSFFTSNLSLHTSTKNGQEGESKNHHRQVVVDRRYRFLLYHPSPKNHCQALLHEVRSPCQPERSVQRGQDQPPQLKHYPASQQGKGEEPPPPSPRDLNGEESNSSAFHTEGYREFCTI